MCKADHQVLAEVFRAEIASASQFLVGTSVARERAEARIGSVQRMAREFARRVSVDRIAFLFACGIEP